MVRSASCHLRFDGTLTSWGANWNSQCDTPPGMSSAVGVAAGTYHTVVLLDGILPVPRLLGPARSGGRFSALAQSLYRKSYALEGSGSLSGTNWTTLSTNAGNGALLLLTDPEASGAQRFYRMRQW